jgi:hypothetical protein
LWLSSITTALLISFLFNISNHINPRSSEPVLFRELSALQQHSDQNPPTVPHRLVDTSLGDAVGGAQPVYWFFVTVSLFGVSPGVVGFSSNRFIFLTGHFWLLCHTYYDIVLSLFFVIALFS